MEVCPCKVIGMDEDNEMHFIRDREHICLECGQCMAICRSRAVTVNGLSYERDFTPLPGTRPDHREFYHLISGRRSVRNFKSKPLAESLLNQILESVSYAPFGAAPEKVSITVINNRKRIEQALPFIEQFLDDVVSWMESPIMRFVIKRKKDEETYHTIKNHIYPMARQGNYKLEFGDRITRQAPALILFHAHRSAEAHTHNSLIYATYVMLAAHALGLGTCMNGIVPVAVNKVKEVREQFSIPTDHEAIMALAIGYPKYKYRRAIIRKIQEVNILN